MYTDKRMEKWMEIFVINSNNIESLAVTMIVLQQYIVKWNYISHLFCGIYVYRHDTVYIKLNN
jgi:hypothetical protein